MQPEGKRHYFFWVIVGLYLLHAFVWFQIGFHAPQLPEVDVLNVGQGDSILVQFAGGAEMLVDAGRGNAVTRQLEKLHPASDRYIDVAMISHPQKDHFRGFLQLLDQYQVGVFLVSKKDVAGNSDWEELQHKIQEKGIPVLVVGTGDTLDYRGQRVEILSPDAVLRASGELNDASIVARVQMGTFRTLLTGDIGSNVEEYLVRKKKNALRADVLKVAHHGSRFSSSRAFLQLVHPSIAVISVGRNSYGHPHREALARIRAYAPILVRTDRSGTVRVVQEGGKIRVLGEY